MGTPKPQAKFAKGDRVRVIRGRSNRGACGSVVWIGPHRFRSNAWRYGVMLDSKERAWVDEEYLEEETPPPAGFEIEPDSQDDGDQLTVFRRHRPRLLGQPDFGELRWIRPGDRPDLLTEDGQTWPDHIGWFAEEADGGVLGRLRLPKVKPALRPIVYLSNEGELSVTALSFIDHIASLRLDSLHGELEPLLRFCRKHKLPAPRDCADAEARFRSLFDCSDNRLHDGPLPRVSEKSLGAWASEGKLVPKPTSISVIGSALPPLADEVTGLYGPDGTALFLARKRGNTIKVTAHRWSSNGFEVVGEFASRNVVVHEGMFASVGGSTVNLGDGQRNKKRLSLPAGDVYSLASTGPELVAYGSYNGTLYRRTGKAFEQLANDLGKTGTLIALDEATVGVFGMQSAAGRDLSVRAFDLRTGKSRKRPANPHGTRYMRMGAFIAATGYQCANRYDLSTHTWSKPKKAQDIVAFSPLPSGDAIALAKNGNVFQVRAKTYAFRKLGRLQTRNDYSCHGKWTALEVAPNKLLVAGGERYGTLLPPELFDLQRGKSKILR